MESCSHMARAQKLKVFRTPVGFHDAYVAAPSRKAALEAWGADSNLFATGGAELIEDPELTREPLANPGKVIRQLRGTLAEHVAALPKRAPGGKSESASQMEAMASGEGAAPGRPFRPKPRPSRGALDRAEAALVELEERHDAATSVLAQRQAELDRARGTLATKQERERGKLERRIAAARRKYDEAVGVWRAD